MSKEEDTRETPIELNSDSKDITKSLLERKFTAEEKSHLSEPNIEKESGGKVIEVQNNVKQPPSDNQELLRNGKGSKDSIITNDLAKSEDNSSQRESSDKAETLNDEKEITDVSADHSITEDIKEGSGKVTKERDLNIDKSGLSSDRKEDEETLKENDAPEKGPSSDDVKEESFIDGENLPDESAITNSKGYEKLESKEAPEELLLKSERTASDKETEESSFPLSNSVSTIDLSRKRLRQELIAKQSELFERLQQATQQNIHLQGVLSNHFRRKRLDTGDTTYSHLESMISSVTSAGIDHSIQYSNYLEALSQLQNQYSEDQERLNAEISKLKNLSEIKIAEASQVCEEFANFILKQGHQAMSYKTGHVIPFDVYKDYIKSWQKKNESITAERLENIKLQRDIDRIKEAFKAYDISESLNLIDFEQMKIENQTYNEKIEERNKEVEKLKRKITNTVHILTHSKEKLSSSEADFTQLRGNFEELKSKLNSCRDTLAKLKKKRDALRFNYNAMQRACGLLGHTEMLRGYEESVESLEAKKQELAQLTNQTQQFFTKSRHLEREIIRMKEDQNPPILK